MATPSVRVPTPPGSKASIKLSVTDIASFVGLRQCGRYLRLSVARDDSGDAIAIQEAFSVSSSGIDEALAVSGRQLEDDVAAELQRRAPGAPYHNPSRSMETSTTWEVFLDLLAGARPASSGYVGCWAAEVVLQGHPTADSLINLSGRADFIVLLWRSGKPVLRIVECKASMEPQTKYIVQLVLYRMLLLKLLAEVKTVNSNGSCVCISGRHWLLPGRQVSHDTQELQVECQLRTKVSGVAGHAADGEALPMEEVEAIARQLSGMLKPSGRLTKALDFRTPLAEVPYELDGHCGACNRAAACWVEAAARGMVQLSGCSASESQRLVKAGVRDIEDLAGLLPPLDGATTVPGTSVALERRQLEDVAAVAGMSPWDLYRLSLTAAVRTRRWLGHPLGQQNLPGAQQHRSMFQLLPDALPSCLPSLAVRASLVKVYLSVAMDVVLHRVVGIAAHIAAPAYNDQSAPLQEEQAGWDVVLLLEGVELEDGSSIAVANSDGQLNELEAQLLADFSDQLCDSIERCTVELQKQQQEQQLMLHFYVHSHQELRELIRRCSTLHDVLSLCPLPATDAAGLLWLPHLLGLRADIGDLQEESEDKASQEQAMVSVIEDEVRRYATVWHGAGRLAATSIAWGRDDTIYDWRPPPSQLQPGSAAVFGASVAGSISSGGGPDSGAGREDLRAIFTPGGYMNCFSQDSLNLHRYVQQQLLQQQSQGRPRHGIPPACLQPRRNLQPLATSAPSASGNLVLQNSAEYVQVRPDLPGSSIPPSFFRALWSSAGRKQGLTDGNWPSQPGGSGRHRQQAGDNQAHDKDVTDVFQKGARYLRSILLAQAHAVRWLEERLVRLPEGGNARLHKVPLKLSVPLGRSLRAFRLDVASLPSGPRRAPQGPHALRATVLARAALEAVWLDRSSQMREFWRGLGSQPPAARASDDRSGTIVLDRLQRRNKDKSYWLQGRVTVPEGCCDWGALAKATGLEEGSSVVVTGVANPSICQDAEAAKKDYALGAIYPLKTSGTDDDTAEQQLPEPAAGDGGLWVECRLDYLRYPANGLFLLGTPNVRPWTFAMRGASHVVLDTAPNISGWVATSVIELLQKYAGGSIYLAQRLWLSLAPPDLAASGSTGQMQEMIAVEESCATKELKAEPRTPGRNLHACDNPNGTTPNSIMQGQQILSGLQSLMSNQFTRLAHALGLPQATGRSITVGPASHTDDACPSNGTSDRAGDIGVDGLVRRLAPELDQDQVTCVHAFLEHPGSGSRVLLQGPPGTGKTETVAAALLTWLADRMRRGGPMGPPEQGGVVLLSGPTHAAIDNLMKRIAVRMGGGALDTKRITLVRLKSSKKDLQPGVKSSLPRHKTWDRSRWYLVGGTLRHLQKVAEDLRTLVACSASSQMAALMEVSGRAACAAALVLDEASMVFAPQLLALSSLLVARGSLLVAGDHQQLTTIVRYNFDKEQRPNLVRHRPYVSAYEYVRLVAAEEARLRLGQRQAQQEDQLPWIGGAPPPVSMCALSYTHRLPYAVRCLIQPLYSRDGITLRGRPPVESSETKTSTADGSAAPAMHIHIRNSRASRFAAKRPTEIALPTVPGALHSTLIASPHPVQHVSSGANLHGTHPVNIDAGVVWRRLWQGSAGEGVFLIIHDEEGSSRLNALEVQLVATILEARPGGMAPAGRDGEAGVSSVGGTAVNAGKVSAADSIESESTSGISVAIITPHRAQRRALRSLVEERGWTQDCQVDTVERMQGGEAETVIFSATVSDAATLERGVEFYSSIQRANVAFSRTRRRLMIIASRAFLEHLPTSYSSFSGLMLWRHLQCMCQDGGVFLGEAYIKMQDSMRAEPEAAGMAAAGSEKAAIGKLRPGATSENPSEPGKTKQGCEGTYRCDVYEKIA